MADDIPVEGPDLLLFQVEKGIDDRCMTGLSELPVGDQMVVIEAVNEQQARNPSAVTWAMVKTMQHTPARLKIPYICKRLDQKATESFNMLSAEMQADIATKLDVSTARNMGAVVWSMIKRASGKGKGKSGPPIPAPQPVFAHRPSVDPSFTIAGTGNILLGSASAASLHPTVADFAAGCALDGKVVNSLAMLSHEEQHLVMRLVAMQSCRNPSAVTWSMIKHVGQDSAEVKCKFLRDGLDAATKAALESISPDEQMSTLMSVDVCTCKNVSHEVMTKLLSTWKDPATMPVIEPPKNPFAALMAVTARFNADARSRSPKARGQQTGGITAPSDLQDFVAKHNLDDRATHALAGLEQEDRALAMRLLESQRARNPSALCWNMVKMVRENKQRASTMLVENEGGMPRGALGQTPPVNQGSGVLPGLPQSPLFDQGFFVFPLRHT